MIPKKDIGLPDDPLTPGFKCPGCGREELYFIESGVIARRVRDWRQDPQGDVHYAYDIDFHASKLDGNPEFYCPYCGKSFASIEEALGLK